MLRGDAVAVDSRNNTVSAQRLVALVGVEDLIVVDAGDALLVCSKHAAEDVRQVVAALQRAGREDVL